MRGVYIRITFGGRLEIPAYIPEERFWSPIRRGLPLQSKTRVWKEEVYFPTEVALEGELTSRVPEGCLAYWPPEKALCLFAWASQPYGPVVRVGWLLGPKQNVFEVEEDEEVVVDEPRRGDYSERLWSVAELLRAQGFLAAPRSWEGSQSVVGAAARPNLRVGFEVFVEDFGFIIESDPLYLRDFSPVDESFRRSLQRARVFRSRLDVSEEGYVVLSEYARSEDELVSAVHTVVQDFDRAIDILQLK